MSTRRERESEAAGAAAPEGSRAGLAFEAETRVGPRTAAELAGPDYCR